jgi:DNA-binding HxlR family transcriptional regulator
MRICSAPPSSGRKVHFGKIYYGLVDCQIAAPVITQLALLRSEAVRNAQINRGDMKCRAHDDPCAWYHHLVIESCLWNLASGHMKPRKQKLPKQDCNGARTILDRIGDTWSLHVLATLQGDAMRFNEIRRGVHGISQRMLAWTLRDLERDGLVNRTVYPTKPPSAEYSLTIMGSALLEPAMTLLTWAQDNCASVEESRREYDEKETR